MEFPVGKSLFQSNGWASHVRVSPDASRVAFLDHPFNSDGGRVSMVDINGAKLDLSTGWLTLEGLAWSPDGKEVWFTGTRIGSATKVYAVDLSGKERLILPSPNALTLWDISKDGRILLTQDEWRGEMAMRSPGADHERDVSNWDYSLLRDITPDGQMIAFDESGEGGGELGAIFIRRWNDSAAIKLGEGTAGGFSPDLKWLATSNLGSTAIVILPIGAGQPKTIQCENSICSYPAFFSDGKRIVYYGNIQGQGTQVFVRSLSDEKSRPITPAGIVFTTTAPVSPDGKWVAALGLDGKPTIFPVEGDKSWPIPNCEVREAPVQWTPDGSSVYLTRRKGPMAQVFKVDVKTGARELWKEVNAADPAGVVGVTRVFPTPDGSAYAYNYIRILSTLYVVQGLH